MTSKLATHIGHFLATSYLPAKLLVPINTILNKKNTTYENGIFLSTVNMSLNQLSCFPKMLTPELLLNKLFKINGNDFNRSVLKHGDISFVDSMIKMSFDNKDKHNEYFVFNTNGSIPVRYIQMLKDFFFENSIIEPISDTAFVDFENKYIDLISKQNYTDDQFKRLLFLMKNILDSNGRLYIIE